MTASTRGLQRTEFAGLLTKGKWCPSQNTVPLSCLPPGCQECPARQTRNMPAAHGPCERANLPACPPNRLTKASFLPPRIPKHHLASECHQATGHFLINEPEPAHVQRRAHTRTHINTHTHTRTHASVSGLSGNDGVRDMIAGQSAPLSLPVLSVPSCCAPNSLASAPDRVSEGRGFHSSSGQALQMPQPSLSSPPSPPCCACRHRHRMIGRHADGWTGGRQDGIYGNREEGTSRRALCHAEAWRRGQ